MQKVILLVSALILATGIAIALIGCTDSSAKNKSESPLTNVELIKRGEYLVSVIGCDDCHSPKKMGAHGPEIIPELRLSGFNCLFEDSGAGE